jgi:5'-methylthioadenosine phosphorylase
VSVQAVIENLNANSSNAQRLLTAVLPVLEESMKDGTFKAVKEMQGVNKFAIITAQGKRNAEAVNKLHYLLPGYFH